MICDGAVWLGDGGGEVFMGQLTPQTLLDDVKILVNEKDVIEIWQAVEGGPVAMAGKTEKSIIRNHLLRQSGH